MPTTAGQKTCWNCEEAIHPYTMKCPYCGVDVHQGREAATNSKEEVVSPYRLMTPSSDVTEGLQPPFPSSPYNPTIETEAPTEPAFTLAAPPPYTAKSQHDEQTAQQPSASQGDHHSHLADMKLVLAPTALLLSGAVFFMFGLALWLFSRDGVFTLHWNGDLWPWFLLSSPLLLLLGWRALHRLDEDDQHF